MNYTIIFLVLVFVLICYVLFTRSTECPVCECPTCDCSDILKQAYEISAKDQADLVYEREQIRNELDKIKASRESETVAQIANVVEDQPASNTSNKISVETPPERTFALDLKNAKLKKQIQTVDKVNETLKQPEMSLSQMNLLKNMAERRAVIEKEYNDDWDN
jgi:hypothetical protein